MCKKDGIKHYTMYLKKGKFWFCGQSDVSVDG
jgi:hypothetical protein